LVGVLAGSLVAPGARVDSVVEHEAASPVESDRQDALVGQRRPAAEEIHAMPRELWKGAIQFGLVHIPVSLFPAEQRDELSFSMLDRRDLQPVGYKRFNKTTGEEVPYEQIVKGYEYDEGQYVI